MIYPGILGPVYMIGGGIVPLFERLFLISWENNRDCHISLKTMEVRIKGARFSKVPIINGPAKLLLFTCKIEASIAWHLT